MHEAWFISMGYSNPGDELYSFDPGRAVTVAKQWCKSPEVYETIQDCTSFQGGCNRVGRGCLDSDSDDNHFGRL